MSAPGTAGRTAGTHVTAAFRAGVVCAVAVAALGACTQSPDDDAPALPTPGTVTTVSSPGTTTSGPGTTTSRTATSRTATNGSATSTGRPGSTTGNQTTTGSQTTATTATSGPTRAPVAPKSVPPLADALLSASEVSGYTRTSSSSAEGSGATGCVPLDVVYTTGATSTADVLFEKAAAGPYLHETLVRLPESRIRTIIADYASAPSRCATFHGTIAGLGAATFTASRAPVSASGDARAAVKVTITLDKVPAYQVVENIAAIEDGTVLLVLTHVALATADDGTFASAASKAYAKLHDTMS